MGPSCHSFYRLNSCAQSTPSMIVGQHSLALWLDALRGLTTYASHSHCAHRWCDVVYGMLQVMSSNSLQPPVGETIDQYNSCSSTHYVMHHKKSTGGDGKLMDGVLRGSHRHDMLQQVENDCSNLLSSTQWTTACEQSVPDACWTLLRDTICQAAWPIYKHQPTQAQQRPHDTQEALQHQLHCKLQIQRLPRGRHAWHDPSRQALADLLKSWRAHAVYCQAQRATKQLTRRDKRRWKQRLVRDFEQAWDARDFRSMHQSARSLSGRHLGPKRRRYDKPLSCAPSKHQWSEYMQQHGPQGGCSAQVVTWKEHCQQHWSHARSWRERWQSDFMFRQRMVHLANQDLENLRWSTKQNRPRKVAPPWTLPNEIWRMLFWPNSYRYEQKQGLGFVRLNLSVPHSAHVSKRSCRSRGVPIQLLLTGIFRQVPASAYPMARLVVRVFVSSMCLIPSEKLSTSLYGNAQVPKVHVTMLQDMLYTNPGRKPSCSSSASHPVSMLPNVVMPRSSRMSRMLSIPPTTTSWTRLLISQPGWRTKCCSSKGTLQHASKSMGTTARSCWLQAAGRCKAMLSRRSCSWKNTIGLLMTGWQSCALSHGTVFLTQLTPIRVNGLTLLCRHICR